MIMVDLEQEGEDEIQDELIAAKIACTSHKGVGTVKPIASLMKIVRVILKVSLGVMMSVLVQAGVISTKTFTHKFRMGT